MQRVERPSRAVCGWLVALSLSASAVGGCRDRSGHEGTRAIGAGDRREPRDPNEQDKSGTATLTGASWVANDIAIDKVVASRCAREIACDGVGVERRFADAETCTREVRARTHADLKASECPAGIDGAALDRCLDAIRGEACTNAVDVLGRLVACRTGELCLRPEMPHR